MRASRVRGAPMDAMAVGGGVDREPEPVARTQRQHRRNRSSRRALPGGGDAKLERPPVRHIGSAADAQISTTATPLPAVMPGMYSERANRALNIVLAGLALVLLAPLLVLIAIAVKLTSPGPILYAQVRVGVDRRVRSERRAVDRRTGAERRLGLDRRGRAPDRRGSSNRRGQRGRAAVERRTADIGGHTFRIYKFRSMCLNAECGSGAVWATRNDPRVTAVGRILRACRLDELPQLYNVLKGDMNIVGPRPERPSIFSRLRDEIPDYSLRQRARPGITGWAQVRHTYDSCVDDVRKKVQFDLEYLRRRSVWVDLQIMALTIPVMLFKRGAC